MFCFFTLDVKILLTMSDLIRFFTLFALFLFYFLLKNNFRLKMMTLSENRREIEVLCGDSFDMAVVASTTNHQRSSSFEWIR